MPILPVRDFGKYGVITDSDPFALPAGAFSFGKNFRFREGTAQRGPLWRHIASLSTSTQPRFVTVSAVDGGFDKIYTGFLNGRVSQWRSGVEADFSVSGYANSDAESVFTSCQLGQTFYVNREDRVPWALTNTATAFVNLAGGWDPTWRCKVLRAYAGALCAFNVTKTGTQYPNLVKTSKIIDSSGGIPASWDHTVAGTTATENPLAEMRGEIIDAQPLRNAMVIYSRAETWVMEADTSANLYQYRKLFNDAGAINTNCAVEVDGKHFVFGNNDIWIHDGNTKQSIADQRVRRFIYGSINVQKAYRCFVVHNPGLREVHFCFVSADRGIAFNGNGCNRSAVYCYANDTWSFDDLPLVFGAALSNVQQTLTWDTATAFTWDTAGATWLDLEDGFKKALCFVGESNAAASLTASIYALDPFEDGSIVAAPVDTNATAGAYLERDGLDLDDVGADYPGYKNVLTVYPQARGAVGAAPSQVQFGGADVFGQSVAYGAAMSFNPNVDYQLDFIDSGRFLGMRWTYPDYQTLKIGGMDVKIEVTGER